MGPLARAAPEETGMTDHYSAETVRVTFAAGFTCGMLTVGGVYLLCKIAEDAVKRWMKEIGR